MNFKGQKALVTGGSRGIGLAIAKELLGAGAEVYLTATSDESIKVATAELKGIKGFAVDFSDIQATEAFAQKMAGENLDILVNNAGINKINLTGDVAMDDWDQIIEVNLRAPMVLLKYIVPGMAQRNYGRVANITSIFGHVSKSQRVSYSTSKFGLLGMTKAVALDYAKNNVLVNGLAPGFIDTELTRRVLSGAQIEELVRQVPMGRLGTPEEIARVTSFLVSKENSFLTGQNIIVDGGFTCA